MEKGRTDFAAEVFTLWCLVGLMLLLHEVLPANVFTGGFTPALALLTTGNVIVISTVRSVRRRSVWPIAIAVPLTLFGVQRILRDFGLPPEHLLISCAVSYVYRPIREAWKRYRTRRAEAKARARSERAAEWDRAISAATPG